MTEYKDILASWKNSKFVTVDYMDNYRTVILTDITYWAENIDELSEWSKQYHCKVEGMTVSVPDEKTLVLFILRWS